jgi:two-component system response regulator AtoC
MGNTPMIKIIVLVQNGKIREKLSKGLGTKLFFLEFAWTVEETLIKMKSGHFSSLILDSAFLEKNGLSAIQVFLEIAPNALIFVISESIKREMGLAAIREGAHDFFLSPIDIDEIAMSINNAVALKKQKYPFDFPEILGESETIKWMRGFIDKAAPIDSNVLIAGESGTGKDLVSEAIHCRSKRATRPLIKIRCVAQNEASLAKHLFSKEDGFIGAVQNNEESIGQVFSGTILLDEISDMTMDFQARLLGYLEVFENSIRTENDTPSLDARIISTTNVNLRDLIERNRFREDLYYRLNVISIHVPPLRDRLEDIPLLTRHILNKLNSKIGTRIAGVSEEGLGVLMDYAWPGNVRELENVIERAAIVSRGKILDSYELGMMIKGSFPGTKFANYSSESDFLNREDCSLKETMQKIERKLIIKTLIKTKGIQKDAAEELGLGAKNLWKKIQKHGIDVSRLTSNRDN